jgi:uracil-DNA glycosylase family 4
MTTGTTTTEPGPPLTAEQKEQALREIAAEVARCQKCILYKGALKPVPGEGNPNAEVMLIGEAPGWHENQQGRPFVGAAGQFLEDLLRSVGLRRDQVFITNVVKHRPPDNRDPLPDEIAACEGYLDRQIAIIDPRVIVTLGRFSMNKFFPGERISRIHGVARRHGNRLVLPLYHPAAALHQAALRRTVEEDFRKLPQVLSEARQLAAAPPPAPPPPATPPPTQLSLF